MLLHYLLIGGLILMAYLIGSVSSAILISKSMHLPDPRTSGSHNAGATNVLRLGGKKAAILTLAGDILKGAIPILIGRACGLSEEVLAYLAIAAFLGHLFPIFFAFKGGKGVAIALGSILVLSWQLALMVIAIWLLVTLVFRYASLSSLCAAVSMPFLTYFFIDRNLLIPITLISVIIVLKHRDNIIRLLKGTESRIDQRSE